MNLEFKKLPLLSVAAVLTGCSQLHTSDYKEIKTDNLDATSQIDELKTNTISEVMSGATVDEFFVKLEPVKIRAVDAIILPDYLPSEISIYHGTPLTEAELSRTLFLDYGIKVTFNRMINPDDKPKKEDEKSSQNIETAPNSGVSVMDLTTQGITNSPQQMDHGSESGDNDGLIMQDMLALFGNNREESNEKDNRIQKISYNGSLTGFFDWLSLDRGLSWQYDEDSETFVLYDLDTVVFELINNTDKLTVESTVDTSSNSDSGSSGGASKSTSSTSLKTTSKEESEHWDDLQKMINQMLSPNGEAAFDLMNGRIAVTDTKHSLKKIGSIIDQINSSSGTQVVLNLTYIKVAIEETSEIGINLTATDLISGAVTGGASTGGQLTTFQNIFNMNFTKAGVEAAIGAIGRLGTISYKFEAPILTMNNRLTPFQSVEEEHYIAEAEKETDEDGNETITPKKDINKTGITSTWKNRAFGDKVIIEGKLNLAENLDNKKLEDMNNIVLPKNALDSHDINAMVRNGETRVVSIKEITRNVTESSGPFGANSFLFGGNEKTKKRREISLVLVTPYILK